jgi:hypothetical protein
MRLDAGIPDQAERVARRATIGIMINDDIHG